MLPQGTPVKRNYALTQYDFYLQDSFRVKSNLTINLGLRYQLESPPTEINGLQVSSTMPLGQWAALREANMAKGIPSNQDPTIEYVLGGSKITSPFYNWNYKNVAPRLSIAYSPTPKTSIRTGFAMAYDHFGAELINSFGQYGSFGLSTTLQTPLGSQDVSCAPRVTSLTSIPVNGCPNVTNGLIMLPAPPRLSPNASRGICSRRLLRRIQPGSKPQDALRLHAESLCCPRANLNLISGNFLPRALGAPVSLHQRLCPADQPGRSTIRCRLLHGYVTPLDACPPGRATLPNLARDSRTNRSLLARPLPADYAIQSYQCLWPWAVHPSASDLLDGTDLPLQRNLHPVLSGYSRLHLSQWL